jgi:hypothetical protein
MPTEEVSVPTVNNLTKGPNYRPIASVNSNPIIPLPRILIESLANPVVSCRLVHFVQMPPGCLHFLVADISLPPPVPPPLHGKPLHLENNSNHSCLEGIGTSCSRLDLTVVH